MAKLGGLVLRRNDERIIIHFVSSQPRNRSHSVYSCGCLETVATFSYYQ